MQVDLALDAPVAAAQLAGHVDAHAGTAEAQRFVDLQQRGRVEFVADGFMQHAPVVQPALRGHRGDRFRRMVHAAVPGQRLHLAGGALEQVLIGIGALLRFGAARGLLARDALALGELLADGLQVLQRLGLHSKPFSAMDSACPGATTT
jgi:hypothetical protein